LLCSEIDEKHRVFRLSSVQYIFGFALWWLIFETPKLKLFVTKLTGFILCTCIGIVIDSWFYGNLVFAPWKYFEANIIDGVAASFGTQPWWYYFAAVMIQLSLPIGIIFILACTFTLVFKPKHLFLWLCIPFFLAHSCISHKEERFLYPLVYFVPFFLISGYSIFCQYVNITKLLLNATLSTLTIINIIGIWVSFSKPANQMGHIGLTKYINQEFQNKKVKIYHTKSTSPYFFNEKPSTFYTHQNITTKYIDDLSKLNHVEHHQNTLISIHKKDVNIFLKLEISKNYKLKHQTISEHILTINKFYKSLKEDYVILLYEYRN